MTVIVSAAGENASITPVIRQHISFSDFALPATSKAALGATLWGYELGTGGFTGRGIDITVLSMVANSSTKAVCVPAQAQGGTNNLQLVQITKDSGHTYSGFTLAATAQGHQYNGLRLYMTTGTTLDSVKVTGIAGDAGGPPGETFGIATYRDTNTVLSNCFVDGLNVGASGIGLNNATNATLVNCTVQNHAYGMPTNWQGNGYTTENLTSINNYHGMNHERVAGKILHTGLRLHPPGRLTDGKSHAHFTLNNDQADNPTVEMHFAGWSGGLQAKTGVQGPLTFFINDGYGKITNADGSITYKQQQKTLPKLYGPDGNLLNLADAGTAGDPKNGLPAVPSSNVSQAMADPLHWAIRYH